jgi:hypothetical protein
MRKGATGLVELRVLIDCDARFDGYRPRMPSQAHPPRDVSPIPRWFLS